LPQSYKACYGGKDVSRYCLVWGRLACLDQETARRGGCWDSRAQNAKNKLITRQIGQYPVFALDARGYQCLNSVFMVNVFEGGPEPLYILAILNSRLIRRYWTDRFYDRRRTFPKIKGTYLKELPIRLPQPDDADDAAHQAELTSLARSMTVLYAERALRRTGTQREVIERQIDATDAEIDRLVYAMYGLTPEEIALVDGEGT
jgi:hypothetical protein